MTIKTKRILRVLFYPHISVLLFFVPLATALLVYALLTLEENDPLRFFSYIFSTYTLVVVCLRIPHLVKTVCGIRDSNRYVKRWTTDTRLRVKVTLTGNAAWNAAYAVLQLCLGIYHRSSWFCSLSAYYLSLAAMRFYLARHTYRYKACEKMRNELKRYRACGWLLLLMNLALSAMLTLMVRQNRLVKHHEITTITMAAYTFSALTMTVINVVKYRKYNSPVFSASKVISLAAASVSMLTTEGTMLTTFANGEVAPKTQVLILMVSGFAVSALIITMAIYMIVIGNRRLKRLDKNTNK